ncbi:MAG: helix-turn-helix domain-containing protein [FCB group bacterium]|nr:helix-turn-helix domain-containing protein [FCB group bacterium]
MLTADDVLTLDEVKKILKVSTKTLYKLIRLKKLPAKKVGRSWRILMESIDDYLNGVTRETDLPNEKP